MNMVSVLNSSTGSNELFEPTKLHASIVEACLSVGSCDGEAHNIAERVCCRVIDWLSNKNEVTSGDIRLNAAKNMDIYNKDAAYLYKNEKIMI